MKKDNVVQLKSDEFALDIIKMTSRLKSQSHYEISSQLLRSGTSEQTLKKQSVDNQGKISLLS
jgi:four helix bundle protein